MIDREYKVVLEDGVFKELFSAFLAYKQSLGFKYGREAQCSLRRLNAKLNEYKLDAPVLTKEMVEELASKRGHESPATQLKRVCHLRHFAGFLREMGHEAYVYPKHCSIIHHESFAPHIFTEQQISSIMVAADSLPSMKRTPSYHVVWPAIVRVLYGCGLRLTEALCLKTRDVDLDSGILHIEKSKNGTSRYVPVSVSLKKYLTSYATEMNLVKAGGNHFFPAPDGGRYAANTARGCIKKIYGKAGIPRLGNGRLPRIHDLRHTYCCHALTRMQEKGFDLYYSLPLLSAYLGHQEIRDTERYLRLPHFCHHTVVEHEHTLLYGVIPEVFDDEEA